QLTGQAATTLKAPQKKVASARVLMPKKAVAAKSSLHNIASIILKPASSLKPAAKKTVAKKAK
ncbi:MAG: histone, partial [Alphaproteobacteria bacterium]|nr:histone [Alphaproteobacteria bacterium]